MRYRPVIILRAERYFERAIVKDKSRPEAYVGYAEVYIDQDDLESAEEVFQDAIKTQPTNEKLYQAAIDFYMDTEQPAKISELLQNCEDEAVLNTVSEYISSAPEFSLESGVYSEVQEITITSDTGGEIIILWMAQIPRQRLEHDMKNRSCFRMKERSRSEQVAINSKGIPSVIESSEYTIDISDCGLPRR